VVSEVVRLLACVEYSILKRFLLSSRILNVLCSFDTNIPLYTIYCRLKLKSHKICYLLFQYLNNNFHHNTM